MYTLTANGDAKGARKSSTAYLNGIVKGMESVMTNSSVLCSIKTKTIYAVICGYYSMMVLEESLADKILAQGLYQELK